MSDKETSNIVKTASFKFTPTASPSKRGMTPGAKDSNCALFEAKSTDRSLTVSVEEEEGGHAMSVLEAKYDKKNGVEPEI